MPDHPRTLSHPLPNIDQLDLVGIHHIDTAIPIRERSGRHPTTLRLRQIGSKLITDLGTEHVGEFPHNLGKPSTGTVAGLLSKGTAIL